MIDRTHALPVTRQAEALGISRGAVYYVPRPMSPGDLALMRQIDVLHLDFPFAGARMLRRLLRGDFPGVGRRRIGTLMLHMGIAAVCPQPGTSRRHRSDDDAQLHPLLRTEANSGFIEEEDRGQPHQGAGQCNPATHAPREGSTSIARL